MAENAGTIYFTVEAETAKLIGELGSVLKGLDSLGVGFNKTDKAARQTEMRLTKTAAAVRGLGGGAHVASAGLDSLTNVLKGFITLKTAQVMVQMANSYNEMTERVRMATRAGADLNAVSERLLDTANRTYRPLSEAAEVYIRAGSALSSMGKSTSDVLDVTDSLSFAFVKNATSADRADAAINAFTTSVNTGKVGAQAWQTILAAVPTIVDDIAASTGKTAAEIRSLGVQGKLTADQLVTSLQQSLVSNRDAADNMKTTVADAAQALKNNLTVAIGKIDQATGSTDLLSGALVRFSEAVRDADIAAIVREIDAITISVQETVEAVSEMVGEFKSGTDQITSYLPRGFEQMFLSTAKEIDGIASFFQGAAGSIQAIWGALAENIPIMFENAWAKTKNGAADFVNSLADMINTPLQALGMDGIGKVSFGGGALKETTNLIDAAKKGWDDAAKGLGAYDNLLTKITDRVIDRSAQEWFDDYNRVLGEGEAQTVKLTDGTKKLSAAQKQAIKDAEQNKKVIDDLAVSLYLAGLKGEELAATKAKMALNAAATKEEVAAAEALARAIHEITEAENNRQLLRQMDPIENESKRFEDELESLRKLNEEKLLEDQRYLDLKGQAERAHAANIQALQEANFRAQSQWNEMMMASLDALGSSGTSAISGLIVGLHSGADAARMLGNAVLNEVVGSFVQMGIAQVKAWVMGKAAQSAAAAGYLASVTGQVAANTALAAQAAFASTAAIPVVGPGLAPAAAATAAGLAAGFGAPAIAAASTTLAGGRQYGGPTQPGKMYRINENGAPEVFNAANGQQFMLPNTRGHVVSNKDATGGNGGGEVNLTVQLIEDKSRAGQVEQSRMDDAYIVRVVVADIMGEGDITKAGMGHLNWRRQGR
ncbi:tape measure protein [Alcaligenes faecalis]|uniref:tape measure protein n=1 Tax=Alcaligenes faecalis TaxID=511 RepID=UPI001EF113BF|nr:tape measure protein [Alcaligenes faecalis]ULH08235.1 tape measure protein [Alcaligenes faecalis]